MAVPTHARTRAKPYPTRRGPATKVQIAEAKQPTTLQATRNVVRAAGPPPPADWWDAIEAPAAPTPLGPWTRRGLTLTMLPVAAALRALRPIVHVRTGRLRGDRIGHFAGNTEIALAKGEQDPSRKHGRRTIDLYWTETPVANDHLLNMWRREVKLRPRLAEALGRADRLLPGHARHDIPVDTDRDTTDVLAHSRPHLRFTTEEERLGRAALEHYGIPRENVDGDFVAFAVRDSAYLTDHLGSDVDVDYHDYRDADVANQHLAVSALCNRGLPTLRMGATVAKDLDLQHPNYIDYAKHHRHPFMDLYLSAKCRFFIGDTAGLYEVPMAFRRPIAFVNMVPIEYVPTWGPNDLFIPKLLWLNAEKRYLTFREAFTTGASRFIKSWQYADAGITPIENDPDDIRDLVTEMDDRLSGRWQDTPETDALQQRFWRLFPHDPTMHGTIRTRIGTRFLQRHAELLD